jgi:transposase-like protein
MNDSQLREFISSLSENQKSTLLLILKQKKNLDPNENQTLLAEILYDKKSVSDIKEERFSNGLFCSKCGCTTNIVKAGKGRNNKQRYLCKNCSKIFTSTTDTFLHSTKKDIGIWKQYIQCMVRKYSIRKSTEECNISIRTSFMWRHKILDALRLSDKTQLECIVEADEAYFRVSHKGSKVLDRKPRRRGGETHKRGLSKEQVCVVCSIERESKEFVAKIGGLGKTSIKTISSVLNNKIKEKSVFCTDKEKSYLKFAKSNKLEHIRFEEFKSKRGIYHINHINSYHTRLKKLIDNFNGVSTKHLNNYLIWNNVINENSLQNSESFMINKVLSRGLQHIGCTLYKDVCSSIAIAA